MLRPNFNSLRDLHDCANDLLQLPATQQDLVQHQNVKWVNQVEEGSLRILDVCGTTRNVLLLAREHLQDLQTAFRRSVGERVLEIKIDAYNFSRKNMKKQMLKCLDSLKQMKINSTSPSASDDTDHRLLVVVNVIQQVLVTTISIVETVLSYMSMTTRKKAGSNRSSFIWKIRRVKRVARALEENVMDGAESLDTALGALHGNNPNLCEKNKAIAIQTATKQLETLEN
ncbi:uncharacterized protein LOC122074206 [Macadamia integrifolia]|uniref:uncharacterized protein LOC122074206 n=1 Tax=Macadamia integrifolia TaxID=60698 RepID=UPI001C4F40F3|nr:uncharacterized protein LOC122074206 [Macadamia integrifolia]